MHRQVGSHCSVPSLPLCQTPETCSCYVFFGLYLLRQIMFVPKRSIKYPCIRNFYLQLPVCLISNSIATVQHLCLWAWEGSVKSAHMIGQLQICITEQPKLSLPKASQWDCLTFRQILDIKPRVHDTFTYAQVRITKAPCIANEEKWEILTQTGDRKSGLWKIKVVFPLTVGRQL